MKTSDIIKHLGKILSTNTGLRVYIEDINKIQRPCLHIELVSSTKQNLAHYRELRNVTFDIKYYPEKANTSCNSEIQDALEDINLAFENYGNKNLIVHDRVFTLKNENINIIDDIGHFMFDIEFITQYGTEKQYDLMQKLELGGL